MSRRFTCARFRFGFSFFRELYSPSSTDILAIHMQLCRIRTRKQEKKKHKVNYATNTTHTLTLACKRHHRRRRRRALNVFFNKVNFWFYILGVLDVRECGCSYVPCSRLNIERVDREKNMGKARCREHSKITPYIQVNAKRKTSFRQYLWSCRLILRILSFFFSSLLVSHSVLVCSHFNLKRFYFTLFIPTWVSCARFCAQQKKNRKRLNLHNL